MTAFTRRTGQIDGVADLTRDLDRRRAVPRDAGRVGPQPFEAVELARLGEEDVHDEVTEVEQHP